VLGLAEIELAAVAVEVVAGRLLGGDAEIARAARDLDAVDLEGLVGEALEQDVDRVGRQRHSAIVDLPGVAKDLELGPDRRGQVVEAQAQIRAVVLAVEQEMHVSLRC
jgi:hypothetical protein